MTAQQRVWRQWGATNKQSAFTINQHLIWLEYSLRQEYEIILNYGHRTYSDIPEFNFIVGYTISVNPYIFPNIMESKSTAIQLIKKAWNLERSNLIYKMVRTGDSLPGS